MEEVGISFDGEIKISDDVSVLTQKNIPMATISETKETYLKVMEIRELTEKEAELVKGVRGFLKRVFHEVYNENKFWIFWTLYLLYCSSFSVYKENLLMFLISVGCLIINMKPISFYKFIQKILNEPQKIEELKSYLHEKNVSAYVESVENDEDIKMYVKYQSN